MRRPTPLPDPDVTPVRRPPAVLVPGRMVPSAITIAVVGAVLTIVQLVNAAVGYDLNRFGIRPRTRAGLWGILDAPLLHTSWSHLLSNLIPVLVLGFLVLVAGLRQFVSVTVLIWLLSGFGVWLTGTAGSTVVGASTVVFGWLAFLVFRGVFTRRFTQLVLGLVVLAIYGGMFWGVLPGRPDISWQGHLSGAVAGVLAAFLVARADATQRERLGPGSG